MSHKKIIKPVVIFAVIIGSFLVHDLFTELSSDKLFFPFLFENDCFHQIFGKDITDEEIISFECFTESWWGNDSSNEIAFFCDEQCFLSLFGSEYQVLKQSKIGQIEEKSFPPTHLYSTFKRRLEKHYGKKKVNQVVIYYFFHDEDLSGEELWYEPDSKLCMSITYRF